MYRILEKYFIEVKNNLNDNITDINIINFLIKYLKKNGKTATILIPIFKFEKESDEYLIEKLIENQQFVDFNYIAPDIIKRMYIINKNKEAIYFNKFKEMKNEYQHLIDEINQKHEALDEKIKSEIIKNEIFLINYKIKNTDYEIDNWEKLLPNNNEV